MNFGKIVIYGFALVFCALGVGLLVAAVDTIQAGETTNALAVLFGAVVFGGVGLTVFGLAVAGQRHQARQTALRGAHPDEPWMWRDDWAAGRIQSTVKSTAWFFWGFGLFWNLLSTPLLFFLPDEILEKGNYAALLGLLFPLVGVGLVIAAIRKTIQQRKFGECVFLMGRVPGVLGGEVRGTIMIPRGLPAGENLGVRLSCIHRVRQRSGKSTSTQEHLLWQTGQSVAPLSPAGGEAAQGAAVSFRVPFDASPTGEMDSDNSIIWRLEANAAVPGVDFAAGFEIPVYRTAASSPEITEERLRSEDVTATTLTVASGGSAGVDVVMSAGGGKEFILSPRRGRSGVLPLTGFVVVFAGVSVLLVYAGAPFIFPLVFGSFTLIMIFSAVFNAFGESRIIVQDGHVSVRNSLFGIMRGKRMPCSSIVKIGVKGEGRGGAGGHFSITFTQRDGKSTSPLQFLPERRHADWLAEELRKAMAPWRESNAAMVSDRRSEPEPTV